MKTNEFWDHKQYMKMLDETQMFRSMQKARGSFIKFADGAVERLARTESKMITESLGAGSPLMELFE
jgi:hypothetical protein